MAEYGFTFLPSHPLPTGLPADCRSWLSTHSLVNGFIQTKIPQISDKPTTGDRKVAAENRKACIAILIGVLFESVGYELYFDGYSQVHSKADAAEHFW